MIFFVCVRLQMRTTIVVCHSFLARMANAFQGTGGATMKMIVKINSDEHECGTSFVACPRSGELRL